MQTLELDIVDGNLTKTQGWLVSALLELMQFKDFKKITIKELCEKAQIARATFYLNFQSKDDVLSKYVEALYKRFRRQLAAMVNPAAYDLALTYFSFWQEHLDFIRALQKQNLFFLLLRRHENWIREIFGTQGEDKLVTLRFSDPIECDFFAVYLSGGLWNLLNRWVESGAKESPEHLSRIFTEILQ